MPVSQQQAPSLYFANIGAIPAKSRTVISVSPIEYRKHYDRYHGSPLYVLESAPKGGFSVARIYDHQEWVLNRNSVSEDSQGEMDLMPHTAEEVARDFINHCIGGNIGAREGVHPGVMLCAGDEPTPAEIQQCIEDHTKYARWCVNDGHALFNRGDQKNITLEHRRQAEWLGVNVPWKAELERADTKRCPACDEEIRAAATRCTKCSTVLYEYYESMGIDPQDDPAVLNVILARRAKKAPIAAQPIAPPLQAPQKQK